MQQNSSEKQKNLKAISIWQPWASAMASGEKQNETRNRLTHYRGDLVICSARRKPKLVEVGPEDYVSSISLPYGFALCVVELYHCVPTEAFYDPLGGLSLSLTEKDLGDYSPGRFAWLTCNLRKLKTPIPVKGYQGWFNLSYETSAQILSQI